MRRSCSGSRLLLLVVVLLLAPRAGAVSIDVTGTNGDPGIDGVAGGDGGPGGPGGDASADATSADADNSATATSGNGGNGGAGSPPGLGGAGGVGGSATANAATVGVPSDPVTANATALGGNGGMGGASSGDAQAQSGAGGTAQASASAMGSGQVIVQVGATGGNGGDGRQAGDGGQAHVTSASGISTGGGVVQVSAGVAGGNGGSTDPNPGQNGNGANAVITDAVSGSTSGDLWLWQGASGGVAGGGGLGASAAHGGSATSSLTTGVAGQNATVSSQAVGGSSYSGGQGGAASSTTDITSSADDTSLFSRALAGLGGTVHGAVATQQAHLEILAPPGGGFRSGNVNGEAMGGDCWVGGSGCRGGDATSTSTGNAAGSSTFLEVSDSATGGGGGFGDEGTTTRQDGGAGGNATSSASAVSEFLAFAYSSATGGSGGEGVGPDSIGGAGGAASASAFASGGTNALASVTVTGGAGSQGVGASGRGGDVALENVPVAEAPNQIILTQNAYGGSSGLGPASRGGDARSVLTNTGYQGLALQLNASAVGGTAQALDGAAPARAGDASVVLDGIVSGLRDVYVTGDSTAGSLIGANGELGSATIAVHAESGSGAANAMGTATGGSGVHGGSLALTDAVSGDTSGSLQLTQVVNGGAGTESSGSATSVLHKSTNSRALGVTATAVAGSVSSDLEVPPAGPFDAAGATAQAEGANGLGGSDVSASATGGGTYSGTGGDAEAHANSTRTSADPGDLGAASAAADATGGSAGTADLSLTGHGGNAHALATATTAYGKGVTAQAIATGGYGVTVSNAQVGGSALAEATVTSSLQGSGAVQAVARATGGRSFAPGSDANQITGLAHAIATANADASGSQFPVVTADGFAIGAGATTAESHVATNFNAIAGLHSSITGAAPGTDPLHSVAQTNYFNAELVSVVSILSTDAGAAYVNSRATTSTWMDNNAKVFGAFAQGGKTVAEGLFTAKSSLEDWSASIEVDLDTRTFLPGKNVTLGFLDPQLPSLGLDVLSVHISVNDAPVTDMTFTNAADALAALDDEVVILPASLFASNPIAAIRVSMDYQSTSPSGGFLSNFVVIAPVPEPALLALVGLGVALVALTRARAARGAH